MAAIFFTNFDPGWVKGTKWVQMGPYRLKWAKCSSSIIILTSNGRCAFDREFVHIHHDDHDDHEDHQDHEGHEDHEDHEVYMYNLPINRTAAVTGKL